MSRSAISIKLRTKAKFVTEGLTNYKAQLQERLTFELPEKYKGGKIENLLLYWKNLLRDYTDVAKDTVKDVRLKPVKAFTIFTGLGMAGYFSAKNPDEQSFRDQLITCANDVLLVGESTRSEEAAEHLVSLERYYNAGLLRRLNLGVLSIMWFDNYNKSCSLYQAQCSYLKPQYLKFSERIVDVGLLNRWWIIEKKMKDFDVNTAEWSN